MAIASSLEVAPPAVPTNLTATTINETSIALAWDAVEGAESYNIYQDEEFLTTVEADATSYTVENLKAGEEYGFAVRAYNSVGGSPVAEEVYVTIEENAPAAPVVTVKEVTETTIVLEWAAVEGAVDYILYFGTQALGNTEGETIAGVQGLEPETEYCFTVTAVNLEGESEASESVCATTDVFTGCYLVFTLNDTYGDGWSYDKVVVTIDGASQDLTFQVARNPFQLRLLLGYLNAVHLPR